MRYLDWTPIETAGDGGLAVARSDRTRFIMRLQDGVLVARARIVITMYRPVLSLIEARKRLAAGEGPPDWVREEEEDVDLGPAFWLDDKLGHPALDLWLNGEERLTDHYGSHDYEGLRSTLYNIEVRDARSDRAIQIDDAGIVEWCVNWRLDRAAGNLGRDENAAWNGFKRLYPVIKRDHFRDMFRRSKSKKPG